MSTLHTITRGVVWNTAATIGLKIISLGTLLIILRNLTLYQYGQVELTLATITTVGLITLPAISSVALADIGVELGHKNFARAKGLYRSFITLQIGLSFVACAVAYLATVVAAPFFGGQSVPLFLVSLALVVIGTTRNAMTTLMQANLAYASQSLFTMLEEFIKFLAVAAFIFIFHLGPYAVLLSIICSQILTQLLYSPRIFALYRQWGASTERVSLFAFLDAHGRWSIISGYAGTLSQTMRPWIIKAMLGTEAVAVFSVAWGLISQIIALVPIAGVVTPLLPQTLAEPARFRLLLEKAMKYQFLAYVVAAMGTFFVFPIIVNLFFPKYFAALPLFKVLLLMLIPISLDLFTPAFQALKAQRNMFFATVGKIILTAVCMAVGALAGGLIGVGVGLFVMQMLYIFGRYRRLQKLVPDFRVSLRDLLHFDQYDTMVLSMVRRRFDRVLSFLT